MNIFNVNMKILRCCLFLYFVIDVLAEDAKPETSTENNIKDGKDVIEVSGDMFKKVKIYI